METDIKIYVLGCAKYADLFKEFTERFQKYWGSPFLAYISPYDIERWSNGVIDFLNSIDDEYFILLHEDFYLTELVDLETINKLYKLAVEEKADRVSLMGNHSPERTEKVSWYNVYKPNQPYQVSFEASVQRRGFLLDHLRPNENPWDSERHPIKRGVNGKILTSDKPCIFYGDKLRQGKLQEEIMNPNIWP